MGSLGFQVSGYLSRGNFANTIDSRGKLIFILICYSFVRELRTGTFSGAGCLSFSRELSS
jgi:hypothetical protein